MKTSTVGKLSRVDIAGAGVTLLLSGIFALGVLRPLFSQSAQSAATTDAAARERKHLESIQATILALSSDIDRTTTQISSHPVQLLPASSLNVRLADIASLANECKLTIKDLKPGDSSAAAHYISLPILLSGNGNYCDVAAMIHLLHHRLPDVEISAFRFTSNADQTRLGCNFDLELSWRASLESPGTAIQQSTADVR